MTTIGLVAGAVGLTAFWAPAEIWSYGYLQFAGGQLASFILGAALALHVVRR